VVLAVSTVLEVLGWAKTATFEIIDGDAEGLVTPAVALEGVAVTLGFVVCLLEELVPGHHPAAPGRISACSSPPMGR
jgi:hypothetical protein